MEMWQLGTSLVAAVGTGAGLDDLRGFLQPQ